MVTPIQPPAAVAMPIMAPTSVRLASKLRSRKGAVQNAMPLVTNDMVPKPRMAVRKVRLPKMPSKIRRSRTRMPCAHEKAA